MADDFHFISEASQCELLNYAKNNGIKDITIFIESTNGSIISTHPKALKMDLIVKANGPLNIDTLKITRNGKILIVTKDLNTADRLLKINKILNIPVIAKLSIESITTKFLIFNIHQSTTCSDIKEELEENNIEAFEVRRFLKFTNNTKIPTSTILITMLGTNLPDSIKLFYQYHKVTMFIDKPRQCSRCYKFTHSTKSCNQNIACIKCGEEHESSKCNNSETKCANCNESHQANDKICSFYKKEQDILKFKCQQHLTLGEARKRFSEQEKKNTTKTYASISHKEDKSLATKDDLENFKKNFSSHLEDLYNTLLIKLTNHLNQIANSICEKIFENLNQHASKLPLFTADTKKDVKEPATTNDPTDSSDEEQPIQNHFEKESSSNKTSSQKPSRNKSKPAYKSK